jgi:hypothetical protein
MKRVVVVAITLGVIGAARAAVASDGAADALVARGLELRREGKAAEALELFERAYSLSPSPRTVGQMGLAEASLQRWLDAEKHLNTSLGVADDPWVRKTRVSSNRRSSSPTSTSGTSRSRVQRGLPCPSLGTRSARFRFPRRFESSRGLPSSRLPPQGSSSSFNRLRWQEVSVSRWISPCSQSRSIPPSHLPRRHPSCRFSGSTPRTPPGVRGRPALSSQQVPLRSRGEQSGLLSTGMTTTPTRLADPSFTTRRYRAGPS